MVFSLHGLFSNKKEYFMVSERNKYELITKPSGEIDKISLSFFQRVARWIGIGEYRNTHLKEVMRVALHVHDQSKIDGSAFKIENRQIISDIIKKYFIRYPVKTSSTWLSQSFKEHIVKVNIEMMPKNYDYCDFQFRISVVHLGSEWNCVIDMSQAQDKMYLKNISMGRHGNELMAEITLATLKVLTISLLEGCQTFSGKLIRRSSLHLSADSPLLTASDLGHPLVTEFLTRVIANDNEVKVDLVNQIIAEHKSEFPEFEICRGEWIRTPENIMDISRADLLIGE
jgi:hypothetical protein